MLTFLSIFLVVAAGLVIAVAFAIRARATAHDRQIREQVRVQRWLARREARQDKALKKKRRREARVRLNRMRRARALSDRR